VASWRPAAQSAPSGGGGGGASGGAATATRRVGDRGPWQERA